MGKEAGPAERLLRDGPNELRPPRGTPECVKFGRQLAGGLQCLMWVAAAICLIAYGVQEGEGDRGSSDNLYLAIALIAVVVVTGCFGYYQEFKSTNIIASFKNLVPQQATVIREGDKLQINANELVVGDLVEIKGGDRVPADIRIISAQGCKVDNSSLTGESEPQTRSPECTHDSPLETRNIAFFSTMCLEGASHPDTGVPPGHLGPHLDTWVPFPDTGVPPGRLGPHPDTWVPFPATWVTPMAHRPGQSFDQSSETWTMLSRVVTLCNRAQFKPGQDNVPVAKREVIGDASETALLKFAEVTVGSVAEARGRFPKVGVAHATLPYTWVPVSPPPCPLTSPPCPSQGFCARWLPAGTVAAGTDPEELPEVAVGLCFAGLVSMIDPPRATVPQAVLKCRTAGIRVGDTAGDMGTWGWGDTEDMEGHGDWDGRDGVTDSPAVKKADIGVAMGIAGSDAAKNAADMILLDDNFASIVTGVEQGRLIFDNLKKSIAYTLTKNIPELTPYLIYITASVPLPLGCITILFIELCTDIVSARTLGSINRSLRFLTQEPGGFIWTLGGFFTRW
ncbi:PREDICTED: potassium-transporting ATPase alpha chain 1-like, partial [Nipponia nippon]|uniref:potassium-transporting ATPase alpha chain 1-like n=1 Tax=Nipponia nippon TaxID=128390 RepID=UPI000510F3F3